MSSTGGTGDLTGGGPGAVSTASTTATTSSATATTGIAAATTDSQWFQHLLNMGPPSAASVNHTPGGTSIDGTGINPLLLQMVHMQQQSMQQMIMMQQQWMAAHGSSVNNTVSIGTCIPSNFGGDLPICLHCLGPPHMYSLLFNLNSGFD